MRKILAGLFIVVVLLGLTALYLNSYLKDQLQEVIENDLPKSISLSYEDLNIDSWGGNAQMKNACVSFQSNDSLPGSRVQNATVTLEGFNHWDYFREKNIHFNKINIHADTLIHYPHQGPKREVSQKEKQDSINNPISAKNLDHKFQIEQFNLVTDFIQIRNPETEQVVLKTAHFNLKLTAITPTITETPTRPFNYEQIQLSSDSLYYKLNEFDVLTIAQVKWDGIRLVLENTHLKTIVSRSTLSKSISREQDHTNFSIKRVTLDSLRYGHHPSKKVYVDASVLEMEQPALIIYRDKRLPDNYETKPLYSQKLRELNFDLMIDSVRIKNGAITYEEKVNSATQAGRLDFKQINASIYNLGNTYKIGTKKTAIDIRAMFMKQSTLRLSWNFDVQNTQDLFHVNGSLQNLPAEDLNAFTSPNLGVSMEGSLQEVYFDITGNDYSSQIDMKMKYDEYKVSIVDQEKKKKKWLASTLANIFISKTSKREESGFKEGQGEVERNRNKSFFNYLWINIKEGMLKSMTLLD
ncbi:hypothetical protein [Leeuwenhoekiella parthenopeia]|uniref:DUF748 domain-containing protein n=1 Tax=Leeuwenhoekiella parthenopeia TaxID=2890320 RepID=A0ABS8GU77_9FLAO|nr:hypothetical protein [Leeuwenhoekiella parthenopeia]MCC4213560.1 hypothetical protein [Leeuwenhoekiella parthenopeia]